MGDIFDFHTATAYARWWRQPSNQAALERHHQLMARLLQPTRGKTILDVGCRAGSTLSAHIDSGLSATGIDPSPYMLDLSLQQVGHRAELFRGFPEELPFEDNSFHYASMVFCLEFCADLPRALEEVFRVTRNRVYIGLINRYAANAFGPRLKRLFPASVRHRIRLRSASEIRRNSRMLLGNVSIVTGSTGRFFFPGNPVTDWLSDSRPGAHFPFRTFIGMVVHLSPRFRTRPMSLGLAPSQPVRAMPLHMKKSGR